MLKLSRLKIFLASVFLVALILVLFFFNILGFKTFFAKITGQKEQTVSKSSHEGTKDISCKTEGDLKEGKLAIDKQAEAESDCTFIGCSMFGFF